MTTNSELIPTLHNYMYLCVYIMYVYVLICKYIKSTPIFLKAIIIIKHINNYKHELSTNGSRDVWVLRGPFQVEPFLRTETHSMDKLLNILASVYNNYVYMISCLVWV